MQKLKMLEFRISEDCIDNPLLPKSEVAKYYFDYCLKEVQNIIDKFIVTQSEYPQIIKPRITQNYEVKYEMFIPRKVNTVGNSVEKYITKEEEIIRLYSDISASLTVLSRDEFNYFLKCLYYRNSNNDFMKLTNYTRHNFETLRKSCIIKLAKSFGVARKINELY